MKPALESPVLDDSFGLYLHVPFCSAICNYCNFNRGLFDAELKSRYVTALVSEIAQKAEWLSADMSLPRVGADTIFFGGGTPSLLEPAEIGLLISTCRRVFDLSPDAEITMEANPESVTTERLAGYRAAGVNRVSFGVQSFRDQELRRLSRLHGAERARQAFHAARDAGFDNVSLDLMMWLPGQRVDEWLQSIEDAIALGPEHLSLYMLEVYPNAPLREEMARSHWSQAPDEDVEAMYLEAMQRLDAAGFEQYEISNVAKPCRRSRHNLKYWQDGQWIGFGCGAHSTVGGVRWKNVASPEDYIVRVSQRESAAVDVRRLTPIEQLGDALFTGLRLSDGIDMDIVNARYAVDVWRRFGSELEPFIGAGLLQRVGSTLQLSRRGMLLAHEVMTVFV